jgi:DNA-directed RNA polymerase beta' subunit
LQSKQFNRGLITEDERYNAVVEIWTDAKDQIQGEFYLMAQPLIHAYRLIV